MKLSTTTIFLAPLLLLAGSSIASTIDFHHRLEKRDVSGVPADYFTEGCAVKDVGYAVPKIDRGIQVAECYVNARIMKQKYCAFEPIDGNMTSPREGGPYGMCSCWDKMPDASNLITVENKNYACMAWTKRTETPAPVMPGDYCRPFPVVCPTTLKNCYSKDWYTAAGPPELYKTANLKPNCTMLWKSSKNPKTHEFKYCDHLQGGCSVYTMAQYALGEYGCDVKSCVPYAGSLAILTAEQRKNGSNTGGTKQVSTPTNKNTKGNGNGLPNTGGAYPVTKPPVNTKGGQGGSTNKGSWFHYPTPPKNRWTGNKKWPWPSSKASTDQEVTPSPPKNQVIPPFTAGNTANNKASTNETPTPPPVTPPKTNVGSNTAITPPVTAANTKGSNTGNVSPVVQPKEGDNKYWHDSGASYWGNKAAVAQTSDKTVSIKATNNDIKLSGSYDTSKAHEVKEIADCEDSNDKDGKDDKKNKHSSGSKDDKEKKASTTTSTPTNEKAQSKSSTDVKAKDKNAKTKPVTKVTDKKVNALPPVDTIAGPVSRRDSDTPIGSRSHQIKSMRRRIF